MGKYLKFLTAIFSDYGILLLKFYVIQSSYEIPKIDVLAEIPPPPHQLPNMRSKSRYTRHDTHPREF